MEKLSMCRICLSDDTRLQSIFGTHLQETYEFLSTKLLVTEDSRPSLACDLCCSRLETCYELRKQCHRGDEMFTQLLKHKAQVKPQVTSNIHHQEVTQMTADVFIKQENVEGLEEDPLKVEVCLQPSDSGDVISVTIVKEEPSDVTASAPRLAVQKCRNDALLNSLKKIDQTLDKVEERKRETRRAVKDTPVEKNKIVESGDIIDVRLHHDKQKSTSGHSDNHKAMSKNKISADQSVNRRTGAHTGDRPFKCNICNKGFNRKHSLGEHMYTHTGEKPYECNVCKKCFTQKCSLDRHMQIHTGEKPHECYICKKCFTRKHSLTAHIHIHTGVKPFKCNVCKKRFTRKDDLVKHSRSHTGEKPYECNVCRNRFSQHSCLRMHNKRLHMGDKPYKAKKIKKSN